jgi:GntR family transcriptional regulator
VIPFRLTFDPGMSLYEQVVYAAKKAIISGKLKGGDPFPSVRALSAGLKINQNTAHKVIGHLVSQGVLEVRSGIGTVVAGRLGTSAVERSNLLKKGTRATGGRG